MIRRFQHAGREWEAIGQGTGSGAAAGYIPRATHWAANFRSIGAPDQVSFVGQISKASPNSVDATELYREVERGLIRHVMQQSGISMTAEEISSLTQLPLEVVERQLPRMMDDIEPDFAQGGASRYHLR